MTSLRYLYPMLGGGAAAGGSYDSSPESAHPSDPANSFEDIFDVLRSIDREDAAAKNEMFAFPEVKFECKTSPQSVCDEEIVELSPDEVPSSSSSDFVGVCAVCGAPARCFHYDVPSCNGCKTFFRRTIVTERSYACSRSGNCKVDCNNRTLCRHCRFNKCVAVGMNPAAIQLPATMDVQKVAKEIQKRRLELNDENFVGGPVVKIEPKTLYFVENIGERLLDGLLYVECKADQLRWSNFNPADLKSEVRNLKLDDFLNSSSYFWLSDKYKRAENWPLQVKYPVDFEDRFKQSGRPFVTAKFWTFMDSLIVVETAKTFPAFQQLSIADQKILLQSVTLVNVLLIQAFFSVNSNAKTLVYPDGVTPIKFRNQPSNLEVEIYCRMLEPFYRLNLCREEYVLIKAIILFQAECPDLSVDAVPILEKAREEYSAALLRFMQAKHGTMDGATRFANAIAIIYNLHQFAQKSRQLHLLLRLNLRAKFYKNRTPIPLIEALL